MNSPANSLSNGQIAQIACLLEATARKPGNVHRFADFEGLHALDFLLSASVIAGPLDRARAEGIGVAVRAAVEATRRVVRTNTNLGMVLLLAPLAAVEPGEDLAAGMKRVLSGTTVEDARLVYQAIRLAIPGGLGKVDDQDVAAEPTVTLLETMRLAADRDLVARQYANGFEQILQEGVPALREWLSQGRPLETAIVGTFLDLLSRHHDSLIVRKVGTDRAEECRRRAKDLLDVGWPDTIEGAVRYQELDEWLRHDGNRLNPGATADLIASVLFVLLRDGTISLPRHPGAIGWSIPEMPHDGPAEV